MPFVSLNPSDDDAAIEVLGKIPPGTLFVFENEGVSLSHIKIKTEERDFDGAPQYVWLDDGTLGSRLKDVAVVVVNLPVGTPTRA